MFNLEKTERVIIAVLAIGLLAGVVVTAYRSLLPAPAVTLTQFDPAEYRTHTATDVSASRININTATAAELTTLKGIGKVLAARIVAYRDEHGPFLATDDIKKVKGIGEALFAKVKDRITLER